MAQEHLWRINQAINGIRGTSEGCFNRLESCHSMAEKQKGSIAESEKKIKEANEAYQDLEEEITQHAGAHVTMALSKAQAENTDLQAQIKAQQTKIDQAEKYRQETSELFEKYRQETSELFEIDSNMSWEALSERSEALVSNNTELDRLTRAQSEKLSDLVNANEKAARFLNKISLAHQRVKNPYTWDELISQL